MKNKLKALFMSLLLVASVLIPSLASAKTVNARMKIFQKMSISQYTNASLRMVICQEISQILVI